MSYSVFLFWPKSISSPMDEIEKILVDMYANKSKMVPRIEKNDSTIQLYYSDYEFHFDLVAEDWVLLESQDIADTFGKNRKDFSVIESSRERIEFYGGEDPDMKYFNEYLLMLEKIQAKLPFAIFDANNSEFWESE